MVVLAYSHSRGRGRSARGGAFATPSSSFRGRGPGRFGSWSAGSNLNGRGRGSMTWTNPSERRNQTPIPSVPPGATGAPRPVPRHAFAKPGGNKVWVNNTSRTGGPASTSTGARLSISTTPKANTKESTQSSETFTPGTTKSRGATPFGSVSTTSKAGNRVWIKASTNNVTARSVSSPQATTGTTSLPAAASKASLQQFVSGRPRKPGVNKRMEGDIGSTCVHAATVAAGDNLGRSERCSPVETSAGTSRVDMKRGGAVPTGTANIPQTLTTTPFLAPRNTIAPRPFVGHPPRPLSSAVGTVGSSKRGNLVWTKSTNGTGAETKATVSTQRIPTRKAVLVQAPSTMASTRKVSGGASSVGTPGVGRAGSSAAEVVTSSLGPRNTVMSKRVATSSHVVARYSRTKVQPRAQTATGAKKPISKYSHSRVRESAPTTTFYRGSNHATFSSGQAGRGGGILVQGGSGARMRTGMQIARYSQGWDTQGKRPSSRNLWGDAQLSSSRYAPWHANSRGLWAGGMSTSCGYGRMTPWSSYMPSGRSRRAWEYLGGRGGRFGWHGRGVPPYSRFGARRGAHLAQSFRRSAWLRPGAAHPPSRSLRHMKPLFKNRTLIRARSLILPQGVAGAAGDSSHLLSGAAAAARRAVVRRTTVAKWASLPSRPYISTSAISGTSTKFVRSGKHGMTIRRVSSSALAARRAAAAGVPSMGSTGAKRTTTSAVALSTTTTKRVSKASTPIRSSSTSMKFTPVQMISTPAVAKSALMRTKPTATTTPENASVSATVTARKAALLKKMRERSLATRKAAVVVAGAKARRARVVSHNLTLYRGKDGTATGVTASAVGESKGSSIPERKKPKKKTEPCLFFCKFGKCSKSDEECRFIHDKSKVAVCRAFLKGKCTKENCPLTHAIQAEKMPVCIYFERGMCYTPNCPYLHVKVSENAPICPNFLKGYCPDGTACRLRHELRDPRKNKKDACSREDQGEDGGISTTEGGIRNSVKSSQAPVAKPSPPDQAERGLKCLEAEAANAPHLPVRSVRSVTASSSAFNTSSLSPDNQGKFYTSSSSASRSTSAELGSLSAAEGFPSPRGADARAGAAGDGGQVSVGVKRGVRIGENKIDREHEDDIESLKPKLPWKRRRL